MAPTVTQKYVSYNGEWVPLVVEYVPPTGTEALPRPTNFAGVASGTNNVLTWVDSAAPDETGYDIYWSTTDLTDWTTGTLLVAGLEPGRQTATHPDGQLQGKVYYGISTVRGAERSGWAETSVSLPVIAPTGIDASWTLATNTISWVDSTSTDETAYELYYAFNALTDWTTGTRLSTSIAPGTQSYTHSKNSSAKTAPTVYYGLRAARGADKSPWITASTGWTSAGVFKPFAWFHADASRVPYLSGFEEGTSAWFDRAQDSLFINVAADFTASALGFNLSVIWPYPDDMAHPDARDPNPYGGVQTDAFWTAPADLWGDIKNASWAYWSNAANSTTDQQWGVWNVISTFPLQDPIEPAKGYPSAGSWTAVLFNFTPFSTVHAGLIQFKNPSTTWMQGA